MEVSYHYDDNILITPRKARPLVLESIWKQNALSYYLMPTRSRSHPYYIEPEGPVLLLDIQTQDRRDYAATRGPVGLHQVAARQQPGAEDALLHAIQVMPQMCS